MESKYKGNKSLISNQEQAMADKLRRLNLDRVNKMSKPVHPKDTLYLRYGKRAIDIILSFIACVVLLPFNLVFGICTFFDVGRPIFYRQTRCGLNGKTFLLTKFRNMRNTTDENGHLLPASQRVTRFGRFMRKYSLDELLNFWSILKGDMSLIGPRPLPMFFHERMSDRHQMRTMVRPGLECPRMIDMTEEEFGYYQLQFENDVWYVENVSFLTDLRMVLELVKMVFHITERSKHAEVGTYFVGYDENGIALSLRKALELYPEESLQEEV